MNERFNRHQYISGWNQKSLEDSKAIIVGMGALGNEVARILAMSGVGRLILCDPDIIEESNLSRTILFRKKDIGRLKVEAAREALLEISPDIKIITSPYKFINGLGIAMLRDSSLVISCLDSKSSRLLLAGRCNLVHAPLLDGGTHPWGGEVRPYLDPEGPCYGCGLTDSERAVSDVPISCIKNINAEPVGAAAPSSALVGTWMGMVAVRYLMNLTVPNEIIKIDGSSGSTIFVQVKRNDRCLLHEPVGNTVLIDVGADDTIGRLKKVIPENSVPIAWDDVQIGATCRKCGFYEEKYRTRSFELCPACQNYLKVMSTLELNTIPDDVVLSSIGIPPREILAVRMDKGFTWIELKG